MGITVDIHNIKGIDDFTFDIPSERGLYAITGENGVGKSTIMSCSACSFFNVSLDDYFGKPRKDSRIEFKYGKNWRIIESKDGKWLLPKGNLNITGFYEGSIVFGNRFKDIDYSLLGTLSEIDDSKLVKASSFISENLGSILRNDRHYYSELYVLSKSATRALKLKRPMFFIKKNGYAVNQLNMSTGENLLLTVLYSIEKRLTKKVYGDSPTFIYLDEIELALHSSSLRRLVQFFNNILDEKNFAIIFSTHSIDILRQISPNNIYYLQSYVDGSISAINPCFPAFATRSLDDSSYGFDFIFLVEDILAKEIVDRLLKEKRLLSNKRVLVQPVGGWQLVLRYAYDIINTHMVSPVTKIRIILDRDIKDLVKPFLNSERIGFEREPQYLPVKSLEKYLLEKLIANIDKPLFRDINDYVFVGKSLDIIVREYQKSIIDNPPTDKESLKNGKALFGFLKGELRQVGKTEKDLVECVIKNMFMNPTSELEETTQFLESELH